MQRELYEVEKDRFDLKDSSLYHLQGTWPKDHKPEAVLDGEKLPAAISAQERVSALERFKDLDLVNGERVQMEICLPDLEGKKKLVVYAVKGGKRIQWFSVSAAQLYKKQGKPQYFIESIEVESAEKICRVRGWAAFNRPLTIRLEDRSRKEIPCEITRLKRVDVQNQYQETEIDEKSGFFFEFHYDNVKEFYIVFEAGNVRTLRLVHLQPQKRLAEKAAVYSRKGSRYMKLHGAAALTGKVFGKVMNRKNRPVDYSKWIVKHLPDKAELAEERKTKFSWNPKFSIVIPLYKTPEKYLQQLVDSIEAQTYGNWELCLSDGSGADSPLTDYLAGLEKSDERIRVIRNEQALQIAENTNAAMEAATGDFIVFADHDDELTPHALFECVKALNKNRDIRLLYSDEDKMSMDGHKFFQPHFKPDFNLDLLRSNNYICHFFVVRREIAEKTGGLRPEYNGAQDYDYIFRCTEMAGKIVHIPRVLYPWRVHSASTADNPASKLYAYEAGKKAIEGNLARCGEEGTVTLRSDYGLDYKLRGTPLVSILIPNKDQADTLRTCLESIKKKCMYPSYEILIIENNSTEEATFSYYKELEAQGIRVLKYPKQGFNYSAINNFGVKEAKGEYLLFLNNDMEIITPDFMEKMVSNLQRPQIGAVGAKLYYPDNTVQHAGIIIGIGGIAGHAFLGLARGRSGYLHKASLQMNVSAVTAACMMMKKEVFEEVGGFEEELSVAFNDVDLCLKVRELGYLVVYDPYAELYHYESKSRGAEDDEKKVRRFQSEIEYIRSHWMEILKNGDPYYNKNLSLSKWNYSLKPLPGMGKKKG